EAEAAVLIVRLFGRVVAAVQVWQGALGVHGAVAVGARRGAIVTEHDPTGQLGVHTADIDREPTVDEHPHVVVTGEGERLPSLVLEEVAKLGGEVEVAVATRGAAARAGTPVVSARVL